MTDAKKTKQELLTELQRMRARVSELEVLVRESEERAEILSDAAFEGLMIHENGVIVAANRAFEEMLGLDAGEARGINVLDLADSVSGEAIRLSMATGSDEPYEAAGRRKDGSRIVCRVRGKSFNRGGRTLRVGAVEDITERKETERILAETEERYRTLYENAPDAIVVADIQTGAIVDINTEAERMLMRSRDEVVGWHQSELHPKWFRSRARDNFRQHIQGAQRIGRTEPMESFVLRSDESEVPVEVQAQILSMDDRTLIQGFFRDITDRKRAEEALRFTQFAVDNAADGIIYIDSEGRVEYANETVCRELGYEREDFLALTVGDIDSEMSPEAYQKLFRLVRKDGRVILERLGNAKDGTIRPVEIVVNHVEFGGAEYLVAFLRDITERKRAEQALRFTQFSVDHAADGIAWVGEDSRFEYVNEWLCERLGYGRDELLAMNVSDIDPQITAARFAGIARQMKAGGHVVMESAIICKDGSEIPVEVTTKFMRHEESAYGVVFMRDLSERKRAEEALRMTQFAVDRAADGVAWLDPEARFVYVNDAFCDSLKYTREELLSMTVYDIDVALPRETRADPFHALRAQRSMVYETYHRTKDGLVFPVEVNGNYIEFGNREYLVAFSRDITERKKAQEALKLSEQRLRYLTRRLHAVREEERSSIAREIHDHLGQALTGLKMDLSWISERLPKSEPALAERAEEMNSLVDETIEAVRQISTRLRPPLLDDLGLDAAIEWQVGRFSKKSGIECSVDLEPVEARLGDAPRVAVFRILQEALTNAARHARAKQLWIRTRIGEDHFVMTIRDDGVGITEAAVADPKSIGLTGMRERATSLGGEVFISRLAEGGTLVTMRMPVEGKVAEGNPGQ